MLARKEPQVFLDSCSVLHISCRSLSDIHPLCPDWGPNILKSWFLCWLSMEDVRLQVWTSCERGGCWHQLDLPGSALWIMATSGLVDICESGLTWLQPVSSIIAWHRLLPEWSWHQPPYERGMELDRACPPLDTYPFHSWLMSWQPTTEIICSQLQDYSW